MARTTGSIGRETADAIAEKATGLIAAHGFAAVSMRMIAEAVGVKPGALYNHYDGKQALLVAVMTRHLTRLFQAWSEIEVPEPPAAALATFARFHVRYHLTRPDDVFLAYMELRSLEPAGLAAISALRSQYEAIPKAIIRRGSAAGAFAVDDPDIAALAVLAMLTGVTTWFRPEGRLSPAEIEDIYVAMTLQTVAAGQVASAAPVTFPGRMPPAGADDFAATGDGRNTKPMRNATTQQGLPDV